MPMQFNIKTSGENKEIVSQLTNKMNLGAENNISRIAFAYSISKNKKMDLSEIKDSKGKEYKDEVLFGKYKEYYQALVCQHYKLYRTDESIGKYIKMHIDDGLYMINKVFEDNPSYNGFDFLMDSIQDGIEALEGVEVSLEHVQKNNINIEKSFSTNPLKLLVGTDHNGEEIYFTPNAINYSNCHIAVAGQSGSGKTYFAQRILERIVDCSDNSVNFIFLDFKGLKDGEENSDEFKPFFTKTNAKYIDAPQTPFPVNPLSFIDNVNGKNKIMGINKFVDIISSYANLGKVQAQHLKEATKECFEEVKNGQYPALKSIYDKVLEIVDGKPSQLTEVLEKLSEIDLFDESSDAQFLNENYYLSLSGSLDSTVRLTSTFLIINYIYNTFMNLDNTPEDNGHKGIRYVLLIDEAHVIFKEKKSKDILEKILREIRSKGVAVVLLSQGIQEFDQPSFDFSSLCETAFLMNNKDKANLKLISKFLGFGENDKNKVARSMEKIENRQAISNIKEFKKAEIFNVC